MHLNWGDYCHSDGIDLGNREKVAVSEGSYGGHYGTKVTLHCAIGNAADFDGEHSTYAVMATSCHTLGGGNVSTVGAVEVFD